MPYTFPSSRVAGPVCKTALLICGIACALAVATTVQAAPKGIRLSDTWIRFIISSRPAAGYFTLSNESDKAVALVRAASPGCGKLMLHRSIRENGRDRMVMVKSVPVPAHGSVKFAPGGYHLMCMSPSKQVSPGRSVPVTLHFKDGGTITAEFSVRGPGGK